MTEPPNSAATPRPIALTVTLVILALAGAAAGAYLDWRWWHPTSGIVVTIGAIGVLLIGALVWASRVRRIRPVAFGVLAFGIGVILGQNLGPSRPPVSMTSGTVTIQLSEPADAAEISGRADCQQTPSGDNYEISGDPNLRLQIGDQPLEQRDTFNVALTKGDMWEYGSEARSDGWSLLITIGDTGPFTGDEFPTQVTMVTDRDSEITGDGSQASGSLRFDGLVLDEARNPEAPEPIELAGTIEWSCGG